ncbi:MAG: nuclear transport factor 2 family protein [Anaerolineales bacterium]
MRNRNSLLSAFDELKNALIECDENKLDELISDNYQGFSLNGTIEDKETILQTFRPGMVEVTKYTTSDMQYEVNHDLGIISGKGCIEGVYGETKFQHEVLFTDIFKYVNDKWRYYRSQVTEIAST